MNSLSNENNEIPEYDIEISRTENGDKVINGYIVREILGRGAFSKVKLVEKDGVEYAMKKINKNLLQRKKKGFSKGSNGKVQINSLLDNALREIAILKKLNHENIVKLHEIIHDDEKGKIYLILDYCSKGSLMTYDILTQEFVVNDGVTLTKYYSEEQIKDFIREIVLGLDYLHLHGIIHRDIKPDNVLLDENNNCKITDFNVSAMLENIDNDHIGKKTEGTDFFMAPECCTYQVGNIRGKPLDVWALGITAYVLAYNELPFKPENEDSTIELMDLIARKNFVFPDHKREMSNEFKAFIKRCLEKEPNMRITLDEIKHSDWLNTKRKSLMLIKKPAKVEINDIDMRCSQRFFISRGMMKI